MWNDFSQYNPNTFSGTSSNLISKGVKPGRVFSDSKGFKWRLVQLETALNNGVTVAGEVLWWKDQTSFVVTNVCANAQDTAVPPAAGVVTGAFANAGHVFDATGTAYLTDDVWVFVLIDGIYNGVKQTGTLTKGQLAITSASVAGACTGMPINTTSIPNASTASTTDAAIITDLNTNILSAIRTTFVQLQYGVIGYALQDAASSKVNLAVKVKEL